MYGRENINGVWYSERETDRQTDREKKKERESCAQVGRCWIYPEG